MFRSSWYVFVAAAAALLGMAVERTLSRGHAAIDALDAVVIGLFGAIGTSKALAAGLPALPAIAVGILSAVGGSILRDVSMGLPIAFLHVGSFYALAAGAGSTLLVVLVAWGVDVPLAAAAGVALTAGVRLASMRFGWTVPEQRGFVPRTPPPRRPKRERRRFDEGADARWREALQRVNDVRRYGG
ncbi:trimeric intracellular cation channel family protein [Agromyces protaetiae]|uniref:trimeric intracellular cation channel family protein n=1 Tax=Agromyces protaetiae TaxID=2509455 RepID=UPI00312C7264